MNIRENHGITLTALVVTIIVLLILAGIAVSSGIEAIENTKYTTFTAELKIMQSYVNKWNEELSPTGVIGEEYNTQFTTNITNKFANAPVSAINVADNTEANATKVQKAQDTLSKANVSEQEYQNFYLLEDAQKQALRVEGVSQSVLVDIKNRKVVSYEGLKYKGKMYYTIDDLSGEGIGSIYNVEYQNLNSNAPQVAVTGRSIYQGETAKNAQYKFTVNVTQGSDYINKGELFYGKVENGNVKTWNKVYDNTLTVDREGTYKFYYKDAAGNESTQVEYVIEPKTKLIAGTNFCQKMKTLAGNTTVNWVSSDTYITQIKIATEKPNSSILTDTNKVSTNDSLYPVYMWYDTGTIWLWSEDNWLGMNPDCSRMFIYLKNLNSISDLYKLDTSKVTNMLNMFYGCSNIPNFDLSNFDTSRVTTMSGMFSGCSGLTELDVSNFNTSSVTSMTDMFLSCSKLTNLDLSNFNTSSVTSMSEMFWGCSNLTNLDVSHFNTSSVNNMYRMFMQCPKLTNLDITGFNTSSVTNMAIMFYGCSGLTELDVSHFNTSNVKDMTYMFYGCSGLTSLDVSHFNTASVTSMAQMFQSCSKLTNLDLSTFNTQNVTNMSSMFSGCSKLTNLDLSNFNTGNVTNMQYMFQNCSNLTSLDVSSFNTGNVTNMQYMFQSCSKLTSLNVSSFNTSDVTNMIAMFFGCSGLTSLDVTRFDTQKVTSMANMFRSCSGLTSLDVTGFNTSNVTNMVAMFYGCSGLTSLDVTGFNTSNVTTMANMFWSCSKLTNLDLSNFNTQNVTSMASMFNGCNNLENIDISNFNTSKVTNMNQMFNRCYKLKMLDLSNFNTSLVSDMGDMFFLCSDLQTIYASDNFSTEKVSNGVRIFSSNTKLVGGSGTTYNASYIDKTYAHIDGGTSNPGYFTRK